MPQTIRDVMTSNPITIETSGTVVDLARLMRDNDTGAVIVLDNGKVSGIATDRDIALRAVAEGKDVNSCTVGDVCTTGATTVAPDTSLDQAISLMKSEAIRRLPVVENDKPIGIVSLGDLAIEGRGEEALDDISKAPANN